jgi:hypothetical protein
LSDSISFASSGNRCDLDYYRRKSGIASSVKITGLWIEECNQLNGALPKLYWGQPFSICLEIESFHSYPNACLSFSLIRDHDQRAATFFSPDSDFEVSLNPGKHVFRCRINRLPLSPGIYTVNVGINQNANTTAFDVVLDYPLFEIELESACNGELDWQNRPWGAVHWKDVQWSKM